MAAMGIGPDLPPHLRAQRAAANDTDPADTDPVDTDPADTGHLAGPALPPHLQKKRDTAGPELPPHLRKRREDAHKETGDDEGVVGGACGPVIPTHLRAKAAQAANDDGDDGALACPTYPNDIDDNEDVGPMLPPSVAMTAEEELARTKADFERRSTATRNKLLGIGVKRQREEWMLELPEEKKAFDVGVARTFSKSGKTGRGESFMWTESPQDRADREAGRKSRTAKPKAPTTSLVSEATLAKKRMMEEKIAEYNREHRGESLMEMHMDKRRHQTMQDTGSGDTARNFSLDQLNEKTISQKSVSKMVDSARQLDSRFTSSTL